MAIKRLLKSALNVKGVKVEKIDFCKETKEISIRVSLLKGHINRCPVCGKKCSGYDITTKERRWRTLDIGGNKTFIVCEVRRVECSKHGIHTEKVPWARHHSNFEKRFEEMTAWTALRFTKTDVAALMRIAWNTVGEIISRIHDDLEPDISVRYQNLRRIGIDETSYRKGHKYITVVTDHDTGQLVWAEVGHDYETLSKFFNKLTEAQKADIRLVSADGANWIKKCVDEYCPNAQLCLDGYHVVTWAQKAMDELRVKIWQDEKRIKNTFKRKNRGRPSKEEVTYDKSNLKDIQAAKYTLAKNPHKLTEYQESCLDNVKIIYPKLFRAYQLKEGLRSVFQQREETVETELNHWLSWASRSRIEGFVKLSKKIRRRKNEIISTVKQHLSNARIEAMNNKIKVLIRKSYGFRNTKNMIDLILITCSNLQIDLPY